MSTTITSQSNGALPTGAGIRRGSRCSNATFKGNRVRLHKALHSAFKLTDASVEVHVCSVKVLRVCILPLLGGGRKQYMLQSVVRSLKTKLSAHTFQSQI
jgi:hypothetical protein